MKDFKVGDRVTADDAEYAGTIIATDDIGSDIRFDDGEEVWILNDLLHHSDEPKSDPKTKFLTELQALLERYDARIIPDVTWGSSWGSMGLIFYVGNDKIKYRSMPEMASDNVFNYDKD